MKKTLLVIIGLVMLSLTANASVVYSFTGGALENVSWESQINIFSFSVTEPNYSTFSASCFSSLEDNCRVTSSVMWFGGQNIWLDMIYITTGEGWNSVNAFQYAFPDGSFFADGVYQDPYDVWFRYGTLTTKTFNPTPEPSTLLLVGLGILSLGIKRLF